jgi:hypothetical protein
VFDVALKPQRHRTPPSPPVLAPVAALAMDLPTLNDATPTPLAQLAVFCDPWPGAVTIWSSPDGASFTAAGTALRRAVMGETLDPLAAGPTGRWDRNNAVTVKLYRGTLSSLSDLQVLGGRNAAAVQRADGAWEILQFANAELIDTRTYRLSRLLRGQLGTEWAMGDPLPAGAPFVVLGTSIVPMAYGAEAIGQARELRLIAAGRDIGDPATLAMTLTPKATALMPLSPVHLRARRGGSGVTLSWIRRTRIGGDGWGLDVPLGEEREAYEIDILSGGAVVRTLASDAASVLYAAADELADFGAPQRNLSVAVYQLSTTVGRGTPAQAALAV